MPTSSALRSGVKNYARYLNVLAGTEPYVAPPVSDFDLLQTEILTGSQASVTFSNLSSTYGTDYQHLQVRAVGKTLRSANQDSLKMQFNGDTAGNYSRHQLDGSGSSVTSYGVANATEIYSGTFSGNATANEFGASIIDILDPFETTKYTTIRALTGKEGVVAVGGTGKYIDLFSGSWRNTAAITSIKFETLNASMVAGTRFSLYGLKAA